MKVIDERKIKTTRTLRVIDIPVGTVFEGQVVSINLLPHYDTDIINRVLLKTFSSIVDLNNPSSDWLNISDLSIVNYTVLSAELRISNP